MSLDISSQETAPHCFRFYRLADEDLRMLSQLAQLQESFQILSVPPNSLLIPLFSHDTSSDTWIFLLVNSPLSALCSLQFGGWKHWDRSGSWMDRAVCECEMHSPQCLVQMVGPRSSVLFSIKKLDTKSLHSCVIRWKRWDGQGVSQAEATEAGEGLYWYLSAPGLQR